MFQSWRAEHDDGAVFARRDAVGHGRWWLALLGKGDKERLVFATNAMMAHILDIFVRSSRKANSLSCKSRECSFDPLEANMFLL